MLNEQLTWPTPCSRIDQPGFVLAHQTHTNYFPCGHSQGKYSQSLRDYFSYQAIRSIQKERMVSTFLTDT
jgi:hypothetical protein